MVSNPGDAELLCVTTRAKGCMPMPFENIPRLRDVAVQMEDLATPG